MLFRSVFKQSDNYALAYITCQIAQILYGESHPAKSLEWDTVTKYLVKENAHHDIAKPFKRLCLSERITATKEVYKSLYQDTSIENRMYCFLDMTGEHYEYKWAEVFEMAEELHWSLPRFQLLMDKNIAQEKECELERNKESEDESDYYIKELLEL